MHRRLNVNITNIDKIKKGVEYRGAVDYARSAVYLILLLSLAVFVIIAAIAVLKVGIGTFLSYFKSMNVAYYLLALLIIFVSYSIRYPKWSMYLRRLGVRISTFKNYMIYMSMYSMDMTPGRWGRAVVSYTINRVSKVRFAVTFPAVVADIFTDFLGFAFVEDAMAIVMNKFVVASLALTFILMLPFFFLYVKRPFEYVKGKVFGLRRHFGFLKKLDLIFNTATMYFKYNKRLRGSAFVYSMLLTIPSMFLNGMAFYFTMIAFGVPLSISDIPVVMFIFSSSIIVGIVTGIPAALGVTDAVLIGQLGLFFPETVGLGLASAITIFFRIASIWFVQGFGFAALLYTFKYWKEPNEAGS